MVACHFHCRICNKQNCNERRHNFEKRIDWTLENISQDKKHHGMTITNTVWHKDHEFTSSLDHNTIKIDGDRKNGFGPKALLLADLPAVRELIL